MESSTPAFVLTVLLGAVVAYVVAARFRDGCAIGTAPRPDLHTVAKGQFMLGNLSLFKMLMPRFPEWALEIFESSPTDKSPTITFPFQRMVFLRTPEELEWIQHTNFRNYVKGKNFHDVMNVMGEGIFVTDGPVRKATAKIFTANNFRGLITDSVEETDALLRSKLTDFVATGKPFDILPLFFSFTLDSFSLLAFGTSIGALESDTPLPFVTAFDYVQVGMMRRFFEPTWKFTELFSSQGRKMRAAVAVLDDFVYKFIDNIAAGEAAGESSQRGGLLSLYMKLQLDDGSKLSRVTVRDSVLNLLIAGRDTTAQNLSWMTYHVLSRPEILAKVRQELDNSPPVTYDTFKSLVYLNAVFNETARLHPAVPAKGETVLWSDWAMGRLRSIWGEDAKQFKPERWIDSDGSLKTVSNWKFHAFNGGYRLCIGKTLATYEAITVMALIFGKFDLSLATSEPEETDSFGDPMYGPSLTLPMKHPLMVQGRVRDGR
ncbi:hypothetical protein RQP46_004240 [Phenoliferia psychrophenolica]